MKKNKVKKLKNGLIVSDPKPVKLVAFNLALKCWKNIDVKEKFGHIRNARFQAFNHNPYASKENMIEAENLAFGYSPDNLLIKNLSFKIADGEKNLRNREKTAKVNQRCLKLITARLNPLERPEILKFNNKVEIGFFGQMNIDRLG
jgi:ATPase subunit of ABC transporter with duplicated ATPase domains